MNRTSIFLILVFFIGLVPAASGFCAEINPETPLLRDGFVMNGVDGDLVGPDSNDVWFFELSSDVNDYRTVVEAGTRLELLPSSALERMTADRKTRTAAVYRLWNSRVTKYKSRNFIFPNFFLPVSKTKKQQQKQDGSTDAATEPQPGRESAVDDPNDVLTMPREVMEKLRARRERTAGTGQQVPDSNGISAEEDKLPSAQRYRRSSDSVLVDRTALLVERDDGRLVFVLDALGRNVQKLSLNLLPCAAMELTELKQAAEPEPLRFKVAGIMTKYKGEDYLLLEKATRTYSHGNFGR
ncbi:MAG: hypothetical protein JXA81_07325 [Sedimentisphaerales bacterium]|nr:hypothetical protein [Sedimentisphaerales bacterium]